MRGDTSSIAELFAAFFKLCKERLPHVLAVMVLSVSASLLLLAVTGIGWLAALGMDIGQAQQFFLGGGLQEIFASPQKAADHALLLGGGLVLLLAVFLLWSWCHTAMLAAAVDEHHGIVESLWIGWKYLFPMLWISTLFFGIFICWMFIVVLVIPVSMAVLGPVLPTFNMQSLSLPTAIALSLSTIIAAGIFFGLILLLLASVIPLTMIFGFIVMIDERQTSIDALLISRLYVRGHWWDTAFKLFLMWLIFTVPLLFLQYLSPLFQNPFALQLISLAAAPFTLLYMVAVYRDLKKTAGKVNPDTSWRCLWRLLAAAGILLPLLGVISAALTNGPKIFSGGSWKTQGINEPRIISTPPAAVPSSTEPTVQPVPAVNNTIIWRDPVGDTSNPLLDIREVTAEGKRGELLLTVTLAKPLSEYFAAKSRDAYAQLVSVYLDVDRDEATGAALPDDAGRKGYDFELNVLLATPSDAPDKGKAYASLYAIGPQKRQSLAPLADGAASIADSTLTIRLPYERLDAAAGGRLKICFRETAQAVGGLSQDQIVPLK